MVSLISFSHPVKKNIHRVILRIIINFIPLIEFMEKPTTENYLFWSYWTGLAIIAASLPLSKYTMSIGQFMIFGAWLADGIINKSLFKKFGSFFKNKAALALSAFYLLHIFGLIYTDDFDYALKDLQLKITMLMLPIVISTSPKIDTQKFYWLLLIHAFAVLAGTLVSIYIMLTSYVADLRYIFPFISHIRFGLNVVLAIFAMSYLVFIDKPSFRQYRFILALMIIWFIVFLIIAELITGLVILVITISLITLYIAIKLNRSGLKLAFFIVMIGLPVGIFMYIQNIAEQISQPKPVDMTKLDMISALGNPYLHDTSLKQLENGYYINIYLQTDELREAWNKRSQLKFDSLDLKNQQLKTTLIRFLTSKGVRKDAEGVSSLSEEEIRAVENGIANINYLNESSIKSRIYEIVWEFYARPFSPNPGGHSFIQRFEFWKASFRIFKDHYIIGVGTGDVKNAFKSEYRKMNSLLEEQYQWRSHNQYLSVLVTFGLTGFIVFIFSIFYPVYITGKFFDYFVFVSLSIILLSMLTEDTLENQAGSTFSYFFYTFFLFGKKDNHHIIN